jgi:uncharacterized membrane protein YkoI
MSEGLPSTEAIQVRFSFLRYTIFMKSEGRRSDMLSNRSVCIITAAGSLLAVLCLLTLGRADDDHNVAKRLKDSGNILPLAQILEMVSTTRPGRVLEIALQDHAGRLLYHIELVDAQGVVWSLQVDATQGTLLHTHKETDSEGATR